jgi:hypothetical protein
LHLSIGEIRLAYWRSAAAHVHHNPTSVPKKPGVYDSNHDKDDSMLRSSFLQSTNFNLSTKAKANNEHHCSAHQLHVTCDPLPFSLFHLSLQVFTSGPPPVGQKPGKGHRTRASS